LRIFFVVLAVDQQRPDFLPFDVALRLGEFPPEDPIAHKLFRDRRTACFGNGAGLEAILSGISIRDEERLDSLPESDDRRILRHKGRGGRWTRGDDGRGPGRASGQEGCGTA
jgi:hypothetical protein